MITVCALIVAGKYRLSLEGTYFATFVIDLFGMYSTTTFVMELVK